MRKERCNCNAPFLSSTNIHEIDTKIGRDESRPCNIFIHKYSRNKHEKMDVVNRVPTKPSIPHTFNS